MKTENYEKEWKNLIIFKILLKIYIIKYISFFFIKFISKWKKEKEIL